MPNTPAAIGQGITALIGNAVSTKDHIDLAHALLSAIGEVFDLDSESQMDAVTGVSGSGPAYVFYMIDALAKAGEAQGLSPDLAMQLAKATVAGAGVLAKASEETPEQLRINVTIFLFFFIKTCHICIWSWFSISFLNCKVIFL